MDWDIVLPIALALMVGGGTLAVFLLLASRFPLDD